MADVKFSGIIPLNDSNYPTWKIQVGMTLMKDGLWNIVNGKESAPGNDHADQEKFMTRRDKALAHIVCPYSLHYYIYLVIQKILLWFGRSLKTNTKLKRGVTNWSYVASYFPYV